MKLLELANRLAEMGRAEMNAAVALLRAIAKALQDLSGK